MSDQPPSPVSILARTLRSLPGLLRNWVTPNLRQFRESRQVTLWALALLVGAGVAVGAIMFREMIGFFQLFWLGSRSERVLTAAANLPFYMFFLGPVIGGIIVGQLLGRLQARRTGGVADVMEARALSGRKLSKREGAWSALITTLSLGFGASAGREGPVVHLGATMASALSDRAKLPEWCRRTMLGAGVASAISASFNAPIAGVLFAHEVILGHYSMRSFVPIVISSAAGSVLSRLWFGDMVSFVVPRYQITSYWEFPAFALLAIVCAIVAIAFQFALFATDYVARRIEMPLWLRPVIGGVFVGAIAVAFPEILGVGYEATTRALWNDLPLALMLGLIIAKTAATAITLASRFGGGIFSPALYLGAMTGGAFGAIAASVFPDLASSGGLYAILGMGAVAAAVLGAPISTTMIVFELTGGYGLSVALLLSCAVAHGINQAIHGHSYFHWQLEMRGLFLQAGPHQHFLSSMRVADFMQPVDPADEPQMHDPENGPPALKPTDRLESALRTFDAGGHDRLPVLAADNDARIIGWASQNRALRAYNRALVTASEEEHR